MTTSVLLKALYHIASIYIPSPGYGPLHLTLYTMQILNKLALLLGSLVAFAGAQRPANESICDYYTTALLKNNTAENQLTLLTLVVNTAVIGNYTQPNVGIMVPGILASGQMQEGVPIDLLKYFNGSLKSTNLNGNPTSVNFLNDGGATPLMANMPANTNSSAQYFLITHLYQYFGTLLGCSMQGMGVFAGYSGNPSQFQVHRFMNLSKPEVDYFITQVGLSAASFGVATSDVLAVGTALNDTFNMRCSAPTVVIPDQGAQLQAICINPDCPLANNSVCAQYEAAATSGSASASASASGSAASGGASGSSLPVLTSAGTEISSSYLWQFFIISLAGVFGYFLVI
jgi:hypothetical protein